MQRPIRSSRRVRTIEEVDHPSAVGPCRAVDRVGFIIERGTTLAVAERVA